MGDFNIDFAKTRDPNRRALKQMADDLNLTQIITTPTRITNKCKSTIDLIFTNIDKNKIKQSGVLDIIISDHLPIFINIKRPKLKHRKVKMQTRSYRYYTYKNFENILLSNQDWRTFWSTGNNIEHRWDILMKIVLSTLNILCPIRMIVRRDDQQPWVDKELFKAISEKNKLYNTIKNQSSTDNTWDDLKKQRAHVRRLLVTKRRQYIMQTLNEHRDDPKKFWNEINNNLDFGKKRGKSAPITFNTDDGVIRTELEISNLLNHHYATVGEKLAGQFSPIQCIEHKMDYPTPYQPVTFRFITMKEATNLIKSLKNSKPSGIMNIKTSILKDALKILIVEFTFLLNECLDKSYVPDCWKRGVITPIPKVNICSSPNDYRPITVLTAASKVLERAVYNQIIYYLDSNGILDNRQHGFRKDHSTLSAIYEVTQHLYYNMDQRNITYCAFIDYSKAFDTLDHDALLSKLRKIGITAQVLNWCRCYLTGRKQCVKNGNIVSDDLAVTCGVPPRIYPWAIIFYNIC